MKHYFRIIALLVSLLLIFSVPFSILAETDSTSKNESSVQDTENTEQPESDENTSSDATSSEDTSSAETPSEDVPPQDTPNIEPSVPDYVLNPDLLLGTKEEGIVFPEGIDFRSLTLQAGLKNYNFSEGLKYWASINDKKPSETVMIMSEGENSFLTPYQLESGDGIMSAPFYCENIIPGQAMVVVYDWSGPEAFTVTLEQYDSSGTSVLSSGFGKTIYKAKNDQEWNTNATKPIHPVRISDDGYNAMSFLVKIEIHNPSFDIKIDNLRIGYSNANGVIYDINGNEIKGEARTSNQSEAPVAEFKPPITDDRNTTDQALSRGGDNEDLINIFIVLGTIALCVILMLVPSAIVKAAKKRKMSEDTNKIDDI